MFGEEPHYRAGVGPQEFTGKSEAVRASRKADASTEGVEAFRDHKAVVALRAFIQHRSGEAREGGCVDWAESFTGCETADKRDDVIDRHIDRDQFNSGYGGALHVAGKVDQRCGGGALIRAGIIFLRAEHRGIAVVVRAISRTVNLGDGAVVLRDEPAGGAIVFDEVFSGDTLDVFSTHVLNRLGELYIAGPIAHGDRLVYLVGNCIRTVAAVHGAGLDDGFCTREFVFGDAAADQLFQFIQYDGLGFFMGGLRGHVSSEHEEARIAQLGCMGKGGTGFAYVFQRSVQTTGLIRADDLFDQRQCCPVLVGTFGRFEGGHDHADLAAAFDD